MVSQRKAWVLMVCMTASSFAGTGCVSLGPSEQEMLRELRACGIEEHRQEIRNPVIAGGLNLLPGWGSFHLAEDAPEKLTIATPGVESGLTTAPSRRTQPGFFLLEGVTDTGVAASPPEPADIADTAGVKEEALVETKPRADAGKKIDWEFGADCRYFLYEEDHGDFMELSGPLLGIHASATSFRQDRLYWRICADLSGGTGTYEGYMDGQAVTDHLGTYLFELGGHLGRVVGKDVALDEDGPQQAVYFGLGLRRWHTSRGSHPGSYDRDITQLQLIPIGYGFRFPAGKGRWGMRGEIGTLLYGRVDSYLSDVSALVGDASNEQYPFTGFGLNLSAFYDLPVRERRYVRLEGFLQAWRVDESEPDRVPGVGVVWEPENETYVVGLRVSWTF